MIQCSLSSTVQRKLSRFSPIEALAILAPLLLLAVAVGCDNERSEPNEASRAGIGAPVSHHSSGQHRDEALEDHDEHSEHGDHEGQDMRGNKTVQLSAGAVERGGIRVAPVTFSAISSEIRGPAEVQLNPDRVAHVSPLVAGQVRRVSAAIGDTVEAGQRLAVLRSIELGRARADDARARALLDVANSNFERRKVLRREGISSERAFLEAQLAVREAEAERSAAQAKLRVFGVGGGSGPDMQLTSPIDGIIIDRHATNGENVDPEDVLFVVADLSRVWVVGRVYEQDVVNLRAGMAATITLRAFPGRTLRGSLSYIASTLDEETRSLAVRVEFDNPEGSLRPGMFGALRLEAAAVGERRLPVVPDAAVQELDGRMVVFIPGDEPNSFQAIHVVVGSRVDGQVEILEGLEPNARIVVEGAFVLKSQLIRSELGEGHAH